MIVTVGENTTLIRLVINHPDKFYKQDWYYNEEFAHKQITAGTIDSGSAGWFAYLFVRDLILPAVNYKYFWTTDVDDRGDRIYVGNAHGKGFQIHRHLTIRPEMFINT